MRTNKHTNRITRALCKRLQGAFLLSKTSGTISCWGEDMKRYCSICYKIHEGHCTRPRYTNAVRNSQADKFRNTQVWRRKAAEILARDFHCCRVCAHAGIICADGLSVHHIIPIARDYDKRLDEDNLITLCRYHHEQAERSAIKAVELRRLARQGFSPKDIPPAPKPFRGSFPTSTARGIK